MPIERDYIDYIELTVQAIGVLVAIVGLGGVILSLHDNRVQQRTQNGPYIRVDIGPSAGIADRKDVKDEYYEDSSQLVNLTGDHEHSVEISSWFRNFQSSPLGFALGVRATFLFEADHAERIDVEIPYLEFGKTVRVGLARIPAEGDITATLVSLTFFDLYDHKHIHVYGQKSTNAIHGRLVWVRGEEAESTPEGRSRGQGVDYNVGALSRR